MIENYKREIGSEFWDIPISKIDNEIFPKNTRWFISGTAALEHIIHDIAETRTIRSVAIPSWCCNCMITPFLKNGISVNFYSVYTEHGRLVCDYSSTVADCWIVLSYFGYSSQFNIGTPSGIIIRDLTHSIFSENVEDAEYYFGSLRKWAGFYTGGYAWSRKWSMDYNIPNCDPLYISLRSHAMSQKSLYIRGKSDSKSYLAVFEQGENFLDQCEPMKAYELDIENARLFDVKQLKRQRRQNAKVLLSLLSKWAIFPELKKEDCPLFVPILIENEKRNALRTALMKNNIYCPIHWPIEKEHVLTDRTKELYEKELSIVCDQRYNVHDMERIIQVILDSRVL